MRGHIHACVIQNVFLTGWGELQENMVEKQLVQATQTVRYGLGT